VAVAILGVHIGKGLFASLRNRGDMPLAGQGPE